MGTPIQFACPHCGRQLTADSSVCGNDMDCPVCGKRFHLQGTASPPPAPDGNTVANPASSNGEGSPLKWVIVFPVGILLACGLLWLLNEATGLEMKANRGFALLGLAAAGGIWKLLTKGK